MKWIALAALAAVASPVGAQTPPASPPHILVSAIGIDSTPPDRATVAFTLRGEGATSDEAATRLRDGAEAMRAGIASLLQGAGVYHSSDLSIAPVRSKECDGDGYGRPRLSTGPCAILGYIATMQVTVDTPRVTDAGTLVSLIGRLGGLDVGFRNFSLRDNTAARRRATQAALANAQAQAKLIAEGSGARLGPLLRVQDADYREAGMEMRESPEVSTVPSAPPPPPPVRIDVAPPPIQTTVRLMVSYGIDR